MKENNEISSITSSNSDNSIEPTPCPNDLARINLWINLEKFDIDIQKNQFDCIIRILNHISNYQRFQFNYYETRKFRAYRPKFKILDSQRPNQLSCSEIKNENALLWFKYAIKMVIKKFKFSKGIYDIWDLPMILMQKYQEDFEKLFYNYYKNPKDGLKQEELNHFKHIVEVVEIQNLFLWAKPVIQEIYKENKKEENKKAKTGFFKKMVGGGKLKDEDLLSREEEEKIEEFLENSVKEATNQVINADIETKIKIDFILNEGSFKFSKYFSKSNTSSTEGFAFKYKDLKFSMRKGEYFMEIDSELKDFHVEMFTLINKNMTYIPITFKNFKDEIKQNNFLRLDTKSMEIINQRESVLNRPSTIGESTSTTESIFENDVNRNSLMKNPNNVNIEPCHPPEEDFVWKLNFRKNAPNEVINSKLFLQVKTLNLLYHQVLLERIIDFFKVDLTEDLASQAWDKIAEIKESTQESLKDAMKKKNIIELKIEPRKLLIPINKYDLKNSKMLMAEIGKTTLYNATYENDLLYPDRYNLNISKVNLSYFNSYNDMRLNKDRFELITEASAILGFAGLANNYSSHSYAGFKLFIDVNNLTVHTTEYLYTVLEYIIDLFKPTKEVDLWSQLNQDKSEIKKNCAVFGKVLKKNQLYKNWEDYNAVLSGGYIYFYQHVQDEEYSGYYYIKDAVLLHSENDHTIEDPLLLVLKNKYGMIEIKFQNEAKHRQWVNTLLSRITEMKSSFDVKNEELIRKLENTILDENSIYFGMEINVGRAKAILYSTNYNLSKFNNETEKEKFKSSTSPLVDVSSNPDYSEITYQPSFVLEICDFNLLLDLTDFDVYIAMSIRSLKVFDEMCTEEAFHQILDSTDPQNKDLKLVSLEIFVRDEKSPKYKNIQIEINIEVGYLYAIWQPYVIRRLLSYVAHNDILRHQVLREILSPTENLLQKNFIEPVKEEFTSRLLCNETNSKYTYIKLNTKLNKVRVIWVQPILNFMYIEMRLENAILDFDMKVDHFSLLGELGNTQIFDLSNYPFTIRSQKEFNQSFIKEILGAKENSSSLISFSYKSMNTWCPECKDNYTSEAEVKINSITLIYIQEHFLRMLNYLFAEFLGALGPSEEVKKFRDEKNQVKAKIDPIEIDFMRLKVVLNNPTAILKARYHFKEHFLVDFGKVTITCEYNKVTGKLRISPDDWRWISTYHFKIKDFVIKTQDNFYLCDPSNGYVNMHFTYLTEEDKLLSDLELDKSFQIDVMFKSINVNLRQVDFLNIMKLNDLNMVYTDEQYDDYNYEKLQSNTVLNKSSNNFQQNKGNPFQSENQSQSPVKNIDSLENKESPLNFNKSEMETLLDTYLSMFVVLFIPKISVKLFLDDKPFTELILRDKQLNFYKKLNTKKEINICVSSMEVFHYVNDTHKEIIISDFCNKDNFSSDQEIDDQADMISEFSEYKEINENPQNSQINSKTKNTIHYESCDCEKFADLDNEIPSEKIENEIFIPKINKDNIECQVHGHPSMQKLEGHPMKRKYNTVVNILNYKESYSKLSQEILNEFKSYKLQVNRISDTKNKQLDLKIIIDEERDKTYMITLNGLKIVLGWSTISLIKQFFMEGFPFYDKRDTDLPNLYDPNEENNPGFRMYLEIKNPLICLLSEEISNQNQDMVCLSTEIVVGLKKEKISKIKNELLSNYTELTNLKMFIEDESQKEHLNNAIINDKSDIWTTTVSLFDVCPFISNMKDILFSSQVIIPKRKIMDNFMLNYESKYHMQYVPPNNYVISNDSKLDLNKMIIKASYRDMVMFLKSSEHHNQQMGEGYIIKYDKLMNYTKRKEECEKLDQVEKKNEVESIRQSSFKNDLTKNSSASSPRKNSYFKEISNEPEEERKNTINPAFEDLCETDLPNCDEFPTNNSIVVNIQDRSSIMPKESAFQKFKPKDIIVDKGMGVSTIVSQGLQLILIDDHANTFYPFLSIVVQEMLLTNEHLNNNQSIMNIGTILKVLVYNYIAGVWEPLIEKTQINIEATKDNSDEKVHSTSVNIQIPVPHNKPSLAFNLNVSDMTISFLYSTMNSWIDKYFKLKNNYSEEIKKLLEKEKNMTITNHTVFNFTGRPMKIYRFYKNSNRGQNSNNFNGEYKKLGEVSENQSYDIEYFDESKENEITGDVAQSLLKENYICFELNDAKVFDNLLKIDNMQSKTHSVNYIPLRRKFNLQVDNEMSKFDYIVSTIKFNNLRKFIYFYSPLSFKNKTENSIIVSLVKRGLSNFFMFLDPKKTVGVPIEYLEGEVQFIYEDSEPKIFSVKKLLTSGVIKEELEFNKKCFNLLYKHSINARNKVVTINNSYCIRNCLPFDLQVVIIKTKEVILIPRAGKIYTDALSVNDPLIVSIFFLSFRTPKEVTLFNPKEKEKGESQHKSLVLNTSFTCIDDKGFPVVLYASLLKGDTKTLVIHSKGVIINNTLLDVKFYYGKDTKKAIEVAGQKEIANVFLLSEEKYLILEFNGFLSHPFNVSAIGVTSVIECRRKNEKDKVIEFVMQSNLSLLSQDLDLYSTIITFSPRFVLYNQMNHPILVSLHENHSETELLRTHEKKAFYFFDKGPQSLISVRVMELENKITRSSNLTSNTINKSSKWNWSEPISILSDSLITVQINSTRGFDKKYLNLEKKLEGSSTFVLFKEVSNENCQFYIENHSSNISCKVWQMNYEQNADFVDIRSKTIFAWSNYREKTIFCVQFFIGPLSSRPLTLNEESSLRRYLIEDDRVTFILPEVSGKTNKERKSLINQNSMQKVYPASDLIDLKTSMYSGFTIKAKISTDGMRKSIIFTDIIHEVNKITNDLTSLFELNLRIEKFGISIISDNKNLEAKKDKYRRYEAVYITFKEIMFYTKKQIVGEEIKSDMQLKILDIEIDNQYSYLSHFPIIMRPINSSKFLKKEEAALQMSLLPPFFNCAIFSQKMKNETTTKILLLNYLIQSFYFTIDSNVVVALMNFFLNLTKELKTSVTNINPVFIDNKINLENGIFIKENYFDPLWQQKLFKIEDEGGNSANSATKLFIQRLETSPIEIIFSFITHSKDKVFQKVLQSNPFFSTFLSTISNVENVPIMLNGSQMNNIYGNMSEILSNVLYIYGQNTLLQFMKMFGSIDILGNPLNLLHNLGTGVKDFFQKPIKGIVKGPLEGAKGVLHGSISLVKHTVEGTFTTTSKITSGISKGILYITQDDDYINDREKKKITEKPKNFVEGIGYGISSMAGGIFYGVTDIVVKPIQGAKKEKWAGLGKGMLKGLAGVVVKPISGVLELVSKTTEGIKNTVNDDDKLKTERLPRPFYGKFKFVRILIFKINFYFNSLYFLHRLNLTMRIMLKLLRYLLIELNTLRTIQLTFIPVKFIKTIKKIIFY
jgi:hypothetical protein